MDEEDYEAAKQEDSGSSESDEEGGKRRQLVLRGTLAKKGNEWDSSDGESDEFGRDEGIGFWKAYMTICLVVMGAGIMALPQLPKHGGWVPVSVCIVACGWAVCEAAIAMWKGIMAYNNAGRPNKIVSYEDFARQGLGRSGELLVFCFQNVYFIGCCSGYAVFIATSASHLSGGVVSARNWLLIIFVPLAMLLQLPDMKTVAKLAPLGVFAIFIMFWLITSKAVVDANEWKSWEHKEKLHHAFPDGSWFALGPIVATCFGASGMNGSIPSILCEMNQPQKMKRVLIVAVSTILIVYLIVMGCGSYGYGQFIQGDIVENMMRLPANESEAMRPIKYWTGAHSEMVGDAVSILLIIKLAIAVPLNVMAVFYSFQTLKGTSHIFPAGSAANRLLRLVITVAIVGIAYCVTDFGKLFALVASISCPMIQTIMPLTLSFLVRRQVGAKMTSVRRRMLHVVIILISIFSMTMGFYESLLAILHS